MKAVWEWSWAVSAGFVLLGAMMHSTQAADSAKDVRVVLFGGSSVASSYLPEDQQHQAVLQAMLQKAYPEQKITVENWASGGEFVARYLLTGAYEKQRKEQPGIDVAIIRFGTNDQKRMKPPEYKEHLRKLVAVLKEDFPGVQIILETGIYVDYPKHYSSDRNKILNPYWQISRDLAKEDGYPLVEYYERVKQETAAGNWDVRTRARKTEEMIMDNTQDAGHENDPVWFTNIHPNAEGVRLAADEEVKIIKELFPTALPTGQVAKTREAKDQQYYATLLSFPAERLEIEKKTNPDKELQSGEK